MMIHINLLPVRQEKKREVGRQFLVVVGGALFITLIGNWLWYDGLASDEKKNSQRMPRRRRPTRRTATTQTTSRRCEIVTTLVGSPGSRW